VLSCDGEELREGLKRGARNEEGKKTQTQTVQNRPEYVCHGGHKPFSIYENPPRLSV
jgi:hypothetical protein